MILKKFYSLLGVIAPIRRVQEALEPSNVAGWIAYGGPGMIFVLLFACGLGLPLPEDIPLLAGGYFVGLGQMHIVTVCVLAWLGIVGGDCVLYSLGRKYGLNITKVPVIGKHVTQERILRAERLYDRWGVLVVAIGRMIAGVRGAMVVAAGAIRFNFLKFLIADGLAALVSGGLFVWIGYWFGRKFRNKSFDDAAKMVRPYMEWFIAFAATVILIFVVYRWLRHRSHKAVTDVALDTAVAVFDKRPTPAPHTAEANL